MSAKSQAIDISFGNTKFLAAGKESIFQQWMDAFSDLESSVSGVTYGAGDLDSVVGATFPAMSGTVGPLEEPIKFLISSQTNQSSYSAYYKMAQIVQTRHPVAIYDIFSLPKTMRAVFQFQSNLTSFLSDSSVKEFINENEVQYSDLLKYVQSINKIYPAAVITPRIAEDPAEDSKIIELVVGGGGIDFNQFLDLLECSDKLLPESLNGLLTLSFGK